MLPAALLLFAVALASAPAPPDRPRLLVVMRPDPGTALSESDLRAIAQEARRIWAPVVDVVLSTPSDVRRPLAVEAIDLAITQRTLAAGDATGLGWIDFINGEPQPAITVSLTAAQQLLATGSWRGVPFSSLPKLVTRTFLQRALGRAIAHEIGHYLLRSTTHDRRGLMRPVFTVDEMMDGRASLVQLSNDELARAREQGSLLARRNEGE
jgi:hypothetical protein